jgi:hypothetical protein
MLLYCIGSGAQGCRASPRRQAARSAVLRCTREALERGFYLWTAGDQPFPTKSPIYTDEEVAEIKSRSAEKCDAELREEQARRDEQARLDEETKEKTKEASEKTATSPGIVGNDKAGKISLPDSTDTAQNLPRTRAQGKRAFSQDPVRAWSGLRSVRVCHSSPTPNTARASSERSQAAGSPPSAPAARASKRGKPAA